MKTKVPKFIQLCLCIICIFYSSQTNAQLSNVVNSYVGNTFSGDNLKWVQNYANELDVASDGTMVTASEWDEAGRCIGIFKNGQPVAMVKEYNGNGGHNCWGYGTASRAIAIDDKYVYVNNCDGDIMRFNRLDNYKYIDKFNAGVAEGMTYSNEYLYLIKSDGVVEKRSITSLGSISLSFTVTGGYDLAVDASGNIWVLTTNNEVLKYDASGANTGTKIAAQSGWEPSAVNYDAYNNLLLVPDNGSRRQVIKFNTSGTQVGTFGDLGGISSGTKGIVGDLRFWNMSGCGTDANGNIYVALNENCVSLRKFNSSGVKQWEVLGTMFTDIASIDPASDGNEIYSVSEHMSFNYSTQQWGLTSITCDRIGNPTDPRNDVTGTGISSALMRRVNGNLIMFTTGMYADGFDVYRFDGEIAVHTQGIWGLGWSGLPDKNGNIWYESDGRIKKIPLTGFSEGTPVFGDAVDITTSLPSPMTGVERVEYDADKDVMFIAGWTASNPNIDNSWGLIGSTIARYPNWSTGNRTASNTAVMPTDVEDFYPKSMSVADEYIFVGGSRDRGKLYVFNSSNLASVGSIAAPTNMGEPGWLDIPQAVQAFKKSNGQYLVLVEDNSKGKNIFYQWCPDGDCPNYGTSEVDSLVLSYDTIVLEGLQSAQLTAQIFPDTVVYKEIAWKSENPEVAAVDFFGKVTATGVGTANITATSVLDQSMVDTCVVVVNNVAVTGIEFNPDSVIIPITTTQQLSVIFTPENVINRGKEWTSADESIAIVDTMGVVTALQTGSVYIFAVSNDGGFTDSCFVEVTQIPVMGISLNPENSVWVNDSIQLNLVFIPSDAFNKKALWESLNPEIASVDSNGMVKGLVIGEANIVVNTVDGNFKDTCHISVLPYGEYFSLDIGSPCAMGSYSSSGGIETIIASGGDIFGEADQFHYVYKNWNANGVIIARVKSLVNTDVWAKAGVMFRETTLAGSKHAFMAVTPGNGTSFQRRIETDGGSDHTTPGNGKRAPYWVKLTRIGNVFTGYSSADAINWEKIDEENIDMSEQVTIGLAVTSHAGCDLITAVFDYVIISNNLDTVPNVLNLPPVVAITAPVNNSTYILDKSVKITANATDPDDAVTRVEFYSNDTLIGTDNTSPYSINYPFTNKGAKSLVAKAFDNYGAATVSSVINLSEEPTGINQIPTANNISIWPNPINNNGFTVSGVEGNVQFSIIDIHGRLIYQKQAVVQGNYIISNLYLNQGMYILSVLNNTQISNIKLLVK